MQSQRGFDWGLSCHFEKHYIFHGRCSSPRVLIGNPVASHKISGLRHLDSGESCSAKGRAARDWPRFETVHQQAWTARQGFHGLFGFQGTTGIQPEVGEQQSSARTYPSEWFSQTTAFLTVRRLSPRFMFLYSTDTPSNRVLFSHLLQPKSPPPLVHSNGHG